MQRNMFFVFILTPEAEIMIEMRNSSTLSRIQDAFGHNFDSLIPIIACQVSKPLNAARSIFVEPPCFY